MGCDRDSINHFQESGIQVKDGRLAFSTEKELGTFMASYDPYSTPNFTKPADFVSYRESVAAAYAKLNEHLDQGIPLVSAIPSAYLHVDSGLAEIRPNVPDGFFAGVLNHAAEIQIGNLVYRYTKDSVYTFADQNALMLHSVSPSQYSSTDFSDNQDSSSPLQSRDPEQDCTVGFPNDRRMKGEIQKNNFGVWAEIRMLTKYQRKRLGIWMRTDASYLELDGSAAAFQCIEQSWRGLGVYRNWCFNCGNVDDASGHAFELFCGESARCIHIARAGETTRTCSTQR